MDSFCFEGAFGLEGDFYSCPESITAVSSQSGLSFLDEPFHPMSPEDDAPMPSEGYGPWYRTGHSAPDDDDCARLGRHGDQ